MIEIKKTIPRSVFVIEDDLELSSVIDRILISIDSTLHLEWATTAEEAMSTLIKRSNKKPTPYDLVICDIFLEGASNGLDLWKFCHKNYPTMKVVIISGIETQKLMTLLDSYEEAPLLLSKPFTVRDCTQLLESLLLAT